MVALSVKELRREVVFKEEERGEELIARVREDEQNARTKKQSMVSMIEKTRRKELFEPFQLYIVTMINEANQKKCKREMFWLLRLFPFR